MKKNVGDKITFKSFAYTGKEGGTGLSDYSFLESEPTFTEIASGTIIKAWNDYETGERYWVVPDEKNVTLLEFLNNVAKKNKKNGYILYVGEFDLVE